MSGSVPTNVVASNGVGVISDAQLDTYVQGGALLANLRAFNNALTQMTAYMVGYTSPGDGGQGSFYWNSSSTATDDGGVTTIQPNGVTIGRWLRLVESGGTVASEWNAGTVNAVGANLSIVNETLIASGTVGVSTVVAGTGLAGGTITGSGTLSLGTIGAGLLFGNPGTAGSIGVGVTLGTGLSFSGSTLESSSGQWSAGAVTGIAGGLTISGTTLTSPTASFAVGTYLWAEYHVAATPVVGTSYAGSTLYNSATGSSFGASGSWQCMGPNTGYQAPSCCLPAVYARALFLRTA
jgi:hypothetical protein